jgi:hypothetical protein
VKNVTLKVNTRKSKVMVISKGRLPINLNFKMNDMDAFLTPCAFLLIKKFSKSFRYNTNKKGYTFSPCLTPFKHGKKFETESL